MNLFTFTLFTNINLVRIYVPNALVSDNLDIGVTT